MHRVISTNKALLKNIVSGEKYGTKWLDTYADV